MFCASGRRGRAGTGYFNPSSGIFTNDLDYCHWYATQWALRMLDLVENYSPDFIYTDGDSTQPFSGYKCDAMQRVSVSMNSAALGRSPWGGDPWLAGRIDEFRIYAGAMLPSDMAAAQFVGPNVLLTTNVSLTSTMLGGNLSMNWPVAGSGFTLVSSPTLGSGAVWTPVNLTPSIIGKIQEF